MAEQTGWKKILLVVVGAAAVLVFALVGLTAGRLRPGRHLPSSSWANRYPSRLPETGAAHTAGAEAAASGGLDQPLRVDIDLEEGVFEVRPGPPGSGGAGGRLVCEGGTTS